MQITGSKKQFIWLLVIFDIALLLIIFPVGDTVNFFFPCEQIQTESISCSAKYDVLVRLIALPLATVAFISAIINRIASSKKK